MFYLMDRQGNITKTEDGSLWRDQFKEDNNRQVDYSEIQLGVTVSTTFLGLCADLCDSRVLLFETMVFGGSMNGYTERYATYQEALAGHNNILHEAEKEAEKEEANRKRIILKENKTKEPYMLGPRRIRIRKNV